MIKRDVNFSNNMINRKEIQNEERHMENRYPDCDFYSHGDCHHPGGNLVHG